MKKCKYCGNPIVEFSRKGKKFCSDTCRYRYHYRQRAIRSKKQRTIDRGLQRNYQILRALQSSGIKSVSMEALCNLGFRDDLCTKSQKTSSGHTLKDCFDLQYAQTATKIFNLKKK